LTETPQRKLLFVKLSRTLDGENQNAFQVVG